MDEIRLDLFNKQDLLDHIDGLNITIDELRQEVSDLKERVAVLAGEAVRVAASEPEPKHHKFRLVKTKQENKR